MIVTILGVLVGAMSLTALIDEFAGTELTTHFLGGIWSVLEFLISPIIDLFGLIWDKLIDIVSALF